MDRISVSHDAASRRFSTVVEGHACELDYLLDGKLMTITHTGVPASVGGRGIAGKLTRFALETARAQGWRVHPGCSYAADYMRRHPEYEDLRG